MLFSGHNSGFEDYISAKKLRKSSPLDLTLLVIRLRLMKTNKAVIRDALTVSGGDKCSLFDCRESVNSLSS